MVFERNATQRAWLLEVLRGAGMRCEPVTDMDRLEDMGDRSGRLDLLVIADSPKRQDLSALQESARRVLSAPMCLFCC